MHTYMNFIFNPKDCIAKIPKDKLDSIVDDCVFDSCLVGDIDGEAVCAQAESLVRTCKEDYKIEIEQWRDTKFCRKQNNQCRHIVVHTEHMLILFFSQLLIALPTWYTKAVER